MKSHEILGGALLALLLILLLIISSCSGYPKGYSTPEIKNRNELLELMNKPVGFPFTDSIRTIRIDENGNTYINGSDPYGNRKN